MSLHGSMEMFSEDEQQTKARTGAAMIIALGIIIGIVDCIFIKENRLITKFVHVQHINKF